MGIFDVHEGFCDRGFNYPHTYHKIEHNVFLVTVDDLNAPYVIDMDREQLYGDWMGDCLYVPANDAPVLFAMLDGKPLSVSNLVFENLMEMVQNSMNGTEESMTMEDGLSQYPPESCEKADGEDLIPKTSSDKQTKSAAKESRYKVSVKRAQRKKQRLQYANGSTLVRHNNAIKSYKNSDSRNLKRDSKRRLRRLNDEELPQKGNYYRKNLGRGRWVYEW